MPKKELAVQPEIPGVAESTGPVFLAGLVNKLGDIADEATYLQKKGRNSAQSYNYAMEADFLELMKPLFKKHRVFFTISVDSCDHKELGESRSGTKQYLTTVGITGTFWDRDSGDHISVFGYGQGSDPGDKGVYKAITGGTKYILSKCFQIPTGDDPEDEQVPAPAPQVKKTPVEGPAPEQPVDVEKFRRLMAAEWTRLGDALYNAVLEENGVDPKGDLTAVPDVKKRAVYKALKARKEG